MTWDGYREALVPVPVAWHMYNLNLQNNECERGRGQNQGPLRKKYTLK